MVRYIVGVDYSITSPGIAIFDTQKGLIEPRKCNLYFFDTKPSKYEQKISTVHPLPYPTSYEHNIERYDILAQRVINLVQHLPVREVAFVMEDYALGAKGKVFNLAENMGILKYVLHKGGYKFTTVTPTELKQFATGKGNATKEMMAESFLREDPSLDIYRKMGLKAQYKSTFVPDLVDAYFLAKYHHIKNV